jgi:hypothetical protein
MTLPTFIGIGVQRAGTTWLHTLLSSHPEVFMPSRRKEIRFFDRYYDRGLGWYESFFCPPSLADKYKAIGEISTQYYDCEECPKRIFDTLPDIKMIIMLRHPVNRAYSHYGFTVQRGNYRGSFESFVATRPSTLEKGYYSRYLKQFFRYFDRSQLLALIFEDVFTDIFETKLVLANFLGIAADKFPASGASQKVNASSVPTFQSLYSFIVKTGRKLRRRNFEPLVDFIKGLGVDHMFAKGSSLPPLNEDLKRRLSVIYQREFDELEECLQMDLASWRGERAERQAANEVKAPINGY